MTEAEAETIALNALAFLAADRERLERFLASTGLAVDDLKEQAGERGLLIGVLDALLSDESALLVFATEQAIAPERILPARVRLAGTHETSI